MERRPTSALLDATDVRAGITVTPRRSESGTAVPFADLLSERLELLNTRLTLLSETLSSTSAAAPARALTHESRPTEIRAAGSFSVAGSVRALFPLLESKSNAGSLDPVLRVLLALFREQELCALARDDARMPRELDQFTSMLSCAAAQRGGKGSGDDVAALAHSGLFAFALLRGSLRCTLDATLQAVTTSLRADAAPLDLPLDEIAPFVRSFAQRTASGETRARPIIAPALQKNRRIRSVRRRPHRFRRIADDSDAIEEAEGEASSSSSSSSCCTAVPRTAEASMLAAATALAVCGASSARGGGGAEESGGSSTLPPVTPAFATMLVRGLGLVCIGTGFDGTIAGHVYGTNPSVAAECYTEGASLAWYEGALLLYLKPLPSATVGESSGSSEELATIAVDVPSMALLTALPAKTATASEDDEAQLSESGGSRRLQSSVLVVSSEESTTSLLEVTISHTTCGSAREVRAQRWIGGGASGGVQRDYSFALAASPSLPTLTGEQLVTTAAAGEQPKHSGSVLNVASQWFAFDEKLYELSLDSSSTSASLRAWSTVDGAFIDARAVPIDVWSSCAGGIAVAAGPLGQLWSVDGTGQLLHEWRRFDRARNVGNESGEGLPAPFEHRLSLSATNRSALAVAALVMVHSARLACEEMPLWCDVFSYNAAAGAAAAKRPNSARPATTTAVRKDFCLLVTAQVTGLLTVLLSQSSAMLRDAKAASHEMECIAHAALLLLDLHMLEAQRAGATPENIALHVEGKGVSSSIPSFRIPLREALVAIVEDNSELFSARSSSSSLAHTARRTLLGGLDLLYTANEQARWIERRLIVVSSSPMQQDGGHTELLSHAAALRFQAPCRLLSAVRRAASVDDEESGSIEHVRSLLLKLVAAVESEEDVPSAVEPTQPLLSLSLSLSPALRILCALQGVLLSGVQAWSASPPSKCVELLTDYACAVLRSSAALLARGVLGTIVKHVLPTLLMVLCNHAKHACQSAQMQRVALAMLRGESESSDDVDETAPLNALVTALDAKRTPAAEAEDQVRFVKRAAWSAEDVTPYQPSLEGEGGDATSRWVELGGDVDGEDKKAAVQFVARAVRFPGAAALVLRSESSATWTTTNAAVLGNNAVSASARSNGARRGGVAFTVYSDYARTQYVATLHHEPGGDRLAEKKKLSQIVIPGSTVVFVQATGGGVETSPARAYGRSRPKMLRCKVLPVAQPLPQTIGWIDDLHAIAAALAGHR